MTLEEFAEKVSIASQKAHLFVDDIWEKPHPIRSVAVRIDDDGVVTVMLYTNRTPNRVEPTAPRETGASHAE